MNTSAHNDLERWEREIARINARIDMFQARFEAEYRVLRDAVDGQVDELHVALRRLEGNIAAMSPDAYAQRVAAEVAELKLKGDAAYDLIQARLQSSGSQGEIAPHAEPPLQ